MHFSSALGDEEDCLSYAERYSKGLIAPDDDVSSLVSPRLIYLLLVPSLIASLACQCDKRVKNEVKLPASDWDWNCNNGR